MNLSVKPGVQVPGVSEFSSDSLQFFKDLKARKASNLMEIDESGPLMRFDDEDEDEKRLEVPDLYSPFVSRENSDESVEIREDRTLDSLALASDVDIAVVNTMSVPNTENDDPFSISNLINIHPQMGKKKKTAFKEVETGDSCDIEIEMTRPPPPKLDSSESEEEIRAIEESEPSALNDSIVKRNLKLKLEKSVQRPQKPPIPKLPPRKLSYSPASITRNAVKNTVSPKVVKKGDRMVDLDEIRRMENQYLQELLSCYEGQVEILHGSNKEVSDINERLTIHDSPILAIDGATNAIKQDVDELKKKIKDVDASIRQLSLKNSKFMRNSTSSTLTTVQKYCKRDLSAALDQIRSENRFLEIQKLSLVMEPRKTQWKSPQKTDKAELNAIRAHQEELIARTIEESNHLNDALDNENRAKKMLSSTKLKCAINNIPVEIDQALVEQLEHILVMKTEKL